jgi:hypothetical protein
MAEGALVFLVFCVLVAVRVLDKIEGHLRRLAHIEDQRFMREIERGDYDRSSNY